MTDGGQDFDLGKVVGDTGATGNGVASVTLISTSGKVKTYRMTFTDGTYVDYQVTDGSDASVTIVTSWNSTTSNSKVPSEKLTKDSLDSKANVSSLSTVATSGSYNDLSNKPTIPTASTTTPSADTTSGSYGSGTSYARSNHTHPKSSLYAESSHTHTKSQITDFPAIPTKTSDLTNDGDGTNAFLTQHQSLTNYIQKSNTTGLIKNDGSIDSNSYLTTSSASSTYQTKLVSGTSIKTINNTPILGSGDISIPTPPTIVTSWETTLSDSKVPSEKLTKNTIDGKLDNALSSTVVSIASNDDILITDYSDSNKIKRVAKILASQVKDGTAHSNIGSSANDTQATINTYINTALGNKVSKSSTTGLLKNDGSVDTSAYITSSALPTIQTSWGSTTSNSKVASEKLIKDSLDGKQATLVSGTNIKTINNTPILGSGDISIPTPPTIVTAWESTPSDSKVASEKLVKNYIDGLIGDAITYIVGSGN